MYVALYELIWFEIILSSFTGKVSVRDIQGIELNYDNDDDDKDGGGGDGDDGYWVTTVMIMMMMMTRSSSL